MHVAAVMLLAVMQQVPATVRDSGRVVLATRLGGDSATASTVELRRGSTYRVEVTPTHAAVTIKPRARDTTRVVPLEAAAVPGESVPGYRAFRVIARESGEHYVELTNPQIGPTAVRVVFLSRSAQDTLPTRARRELVFNEHLSAGRAYANLDSGVVYRLFVRTAEAVIITLGPRQGYRAPVRLGPLVEGEGVQFIPSFTGEYLIEADRQTDASVQIYLDEADAARMACVANPRGPGCRGSRVNQTGILMLLLAIPIAAYVFFVK